MPLYWLLSSVLSQDGFSDPFYVTSGVLQGDTLAPFLFVIALNSVISRVRQTIPQMGIRLLEPLSSREPEIKLVELSYADDIAITAGSFEEVQTLLTARSL